MKKKRGTLSKARRERWERLQATADKGGIVWNRAERREALRRIRRAPDTKGKTVPVLPINLSGMTCAYCHHPVLACVCLDLKGQPIRESAEPVQIDYAGALS